MSTSNSFSHLTLEERRIILTGITNGSTKTAIAQTIGKDKSTVGKEIKLHRALITVPYRSTPDRESILLPGKLRKH
jgi:IS30 family transposase